MAFFFKKTETQPSIATPSEVMRAAQRVDESVSPQEFENALESVASIVRAFGNNGFDTDDLGAVSLALACEEWAKHLLIHSDPPDFVAPRDVKPKRQWRALVRYVTQRRAAEQRFVHQSQTTLRDAVWSFVKAFSRVLSADRGADARVDEHLNRLRAATSKSPEELRREVMASVEGIESVMRERRTLAAEHANELTKRVQTLSEELEDAKRDGAVDPMTKVANRKTFDDHVARVCDLASAIGTPAVLFMIDIDHFKSINDDFGHPAGDSVLCAIADAIARTCKRKSDLVARYGGEEFAVVLADTTIEDARTFAVRIQNAIRSITAGSGPRARKTTASIGIAPANQGEDSSMWIDRADKALYRAKALGRDCVAMAT